LLHLSGTICRNRAARAAQLLVPECNHAARALVADAANRRRELTVHNQYRRLCDRGSLLTVKEQAGGGLKKKRRGIT